ncbi:hypothetical protein CC78DRAFT_542258 [Lojkania enalia]|uniref:Uncharacterized protein n=1 Tax=Lojkania enalia TaxID=147567 RepID=A0A9P4KCB3_9PLEO|nr:hypothetical protein CC78DRAFT_542258 [Didymosphaeria enalia]
MKSSTASSELKSRARSDWTCFFATSALTATVDEPRVNLRENVKQVWSTLGCREAIGQQRFMRVRGSVSESQNRRCTSGHRAARIVDLSVVDGISARPTCDSELAKDALRSRTRVVRKIAKERWSLRLTMTFIRSGQPVSPSTGSKTFTYSRREKDVQMSRKSPRTTSYVAEGSAQKSDSQGPLVYRANQN